MIERPVYFGKLEKLRGTDIIKVITGVRRSGKSTLLRMYQGILRESGVDADQISHYDLEDPANLDHAGNWRKFYDRIVAGLRPGVMNYVFLDEIQNVADFERLADGLFIKKNVDLYLTGSNAYFLSSDLATLLSGRYVEIEILPLSFAEYMSALDDKTDAAGKFNDYLYAGGFPGTMKFRRDAETVDEYLAGIQNTVMFKDVISRTGVNDRRTLESVAAFMFDNIGNITSAKGIADTLASKGRKVSHSTVERYIDALTDSLLFYPVEKTGLKGKKLLYAQKKYYAVDTGLRRLSLGAREGEDLGRLLENVVYFELTRRHRAIRTGKIGPAEVDFVVTGKDGHTEYYQVAWTLRGEQTLERELSPLEKIRDHNPKYILSMDAEEPVYNGIRQLNAVKWLLGKN
jgi:predicted AAA+ superfamily ATPase